MVGHPLPGGRDGGPLGIVLRPGSIAAGGRQSLVVHHRIERGDDVGPERIWSKIDASVAKSRACSAVISSFFTRSNRYFSKMNEFEAPCCMPILMSMELPGQDAVADVLGVVEQELEGRHPAAPRSGAPAAGR